MSIQGEINRINKNVADTYSALEGVGADMPSAQNTDNLPETVLTIKAVRYDGQTLADEQKAQARLNIGAASQKEVNELSTEVAERVKVHYGPDEPTDPDVNMWINTSKPGNNPGSGTSAPADWNAAEGERGHILNRTHYGEWVMLFPEAELMSTEDGMFVGMMETEAKAFRTFRTTYNGVVYEGKSYNAGGYVGFGNMSASGIGEDTGEPFLAMIADGMLMVMPLDGAASVTMQVEMFDIVEKLPKQFYNHHVFIDVDVAEDGTYSTQVVPVQVMSEISEDDVPVIRLRSNLVGEETIQYLTNLKVAFGGAVIYALFLDSMKQITLLTISLDNEDYTIPYTINVITTAI